MFRTLLIHTYTYINQSLTLDIIAKLWSIYFLIILTPMGFVCQLLLLFLNKTVIIN